MLLKSVLAFLRGIVAGAWYQERVLMLLNTSLPKLRGLVVILVRLPGHFPSFHICEHEIPVCLHYPEAQAVSAPWGRHRAVLSRRM